MRKSETDRLAVAASEQARGNSDWRRATCPFCISIFGSQGRRANWAFHVPSGFWHCLRCQSKGRLPGYEEVEYDFAEARREAAANADLGPPEGYVPLTDGSSMVKPARRYVVKRRVTPQIARDARIGYCVTGDYAGRIIVPIFAEDGYEWLGFSGRALGRQRPKYKYPEGMNRTEILYNAACLAVESDEPVLCVEGVFDALPYWPNVIAFLGKPSEDQRDRLLQVERPLVICLDGDSWWEGFQLSRLLTFRGHKRCGFVQLPPRQDPNTVDPSWLLEEARRAVGS